MYYDDELTTKAISEYYGTSEKVKSVITYFYESGSLDKKKDLLFRQILLLYRYH